MKTVDFDYRALELAVRSPATVNSFWRDMIRGMGRAFDPLPLQRRRTFCDNDQIAFVADAIKLDLDKERALGKMHDSLPVFKQRDYLKKATNAKDIYSLAKAG